MTKPFKRKIITVMTAISIAVASFSGCSCNNGENVDFQDVETLNEQEGNLETEPQIVSESTDNSDETADKDEIENENSEDADKSEESDTDTDLSEENNAEPEETNALNPKELDDFIIYFSGIDVWGGVDDVSRSDVNIIAVVNPDTRHIQLVTTPRDFYIETSYSNGQKDKLTHAGMYGVENSMKTLEMLYGINIDYYLRMNFTGFEKIIDTVGGVDVYSECDFTVDPIKHYTQGYNHLTGLEALAFVRERKSFEDGDFQRARNQMALIKGMVKKVCAPEFLMNYSNIKKELTDMYRTNVPDDMMADLIFNQLADNTEWTVDTYSVVGFHSNNNSFTYPDDYTYVMEPDYDSVNEAKRIIKSYLQ